MKSYFGAYYPSSGQPANEATVLVFDKKISIGYRNPDGSSTTLHWSMAELEVSESFGEKDTKVRNSKAPGPELVIEGPDAGRYIRSLQAENKKPWHKKEGAREWKRNVLLTLVILGLLFLLYLLVVPWLSMKLASNVSIQTEEQLGEAVYDAMGMPAQEDKEKSLLLNEFFAAMDIPTDYAIRITVIRETTVNAFALPGGRIVVYSGLLKRLQSYPELAALLCHEFTHVNNKHSTKSIFRRLGSKVFIGLLFGRFGTVTSVLIDHADNLKSLTYSRKLEKEADMEGLRILADRHIDPQGFVRLFENLKASAPGRILPEFMASHPDLDNRIKYINETSAHVRMNEDARLQSIFQQLK